MLILFVEFLFHAVQGILKSGLNPWPQLNVDLPAIASGCSSPRPILYGLNLNGDEAFKR